MGDLISGMVVDLGRSNTRNMTANEFMREMGADPNGIEYKPVELNEDVDSQAGSDFEYYKSGIQQLNALGLEAAAKGIDVYRPNPNNPQALAFAKYYQKKQTELAGEAISLKTSSEVRKQHMLAKQKEDLWVSRLPAGAVEYEDMKVVPTKSLTRAADIEYATMLNIAKQSRGDETSVSEANKQIEELRTSAITRYTQLALEAGLPQEFISELTNKFQGIPKALLDHEKNAKLNAELKLRESQIKSQKALAYQRYQKAKEDSNNGIDANAEARWMSDLLNNPKPDGERVDIVGKRYGKNEEIVNAVWRDGSIEIEVKDVSSGDDNEYNFDRRDSDGNVIEPPSRTLILDVNEAVKLLSTEAKKVFNKSYDESKKKSVSDDVEEFLSEGEGDKGDGGFDKDAWNAIGTSDEDEKDSEGYNPMGVVKRNISKMLGGNKKKTYKSDLPKTGEPS